MAKSRKQLEEKREETPGQAGGGGTVSVADAVGAPSPANEHDPGWSPAVVQQALDGLGSTGAIPVTLIIPVSNQEAKGYVAPAMHVRLNREQSRILKQLQAALNAGHYRRANGQHVDKTGHAIQWVLDQLHIAINRPGQPNLAAGPGIVVRAEPSELDPVAVAMSAQIDMTVQAVMQSFVPAGSEPAEWLKEHCQTAEVGEVRTVMIDQIPVGEFRLTADATSVRYEFERYQ